VWHKALVPLLLSGLILVMLAWWLQWEMRSPYYAPVNKETFVDIPHGAGLSAIADLLSREGILHSRHPFMLYVRWIGAARLLKAGEYQFTGAATPDQVARKIMHGEVYCISITIPEGLTGQEIIDHLTKARLGTPDELRDALSHVEWIRDLAPKAVTLEGYLFPETYRFARKAESREIIKTLVDQFRIRFARLVAEHPIPNSLTSSDMVTLASLIEKEAKTDSERALVASVLFNRLKAGIPLACDPTVIYARKLEGGFDGNLRKADLRMNSPYNTYVKRGLPPGPIANPGTASLRAALVPAQSDFFYYVSRNDGSHQFSRNYREHQLNVNRFQRRLLRKGG
jgi:UPF0755 protein